LGEEFVEALGFVADEFVIEDLAGAALFLFEEFLHEAHEESHVAVDEDGEPEVAEVGAAGEEEARDARGVEEILRIFEALGAGFGERVDADDFAAAGFRGLQRREHARVIRAGVLAEDENGVGFFEVAEANAALADADHGRERDARGLVAHVGAIGEIVGAEGAGEELPEEGGFVAGAAGGVENGLVGGGEGFQFGRDELKGVGPGNRFVVRGAGAEHDGFGEAAGVAEPVVGFLGELSDGVRAEKVGADVFVGGLVGDGFETVLAKFGDAAFAVRIGPGAGLAVEAGGLVDRVDGAQGIGHAGVAETVGGDLTDRAESAGDFVGFALLRALEFDGRLGGGARGS